MAQKKELVKVEKEFKELEEFKRGLELEKQRKKLIEDYIINNLKKGTDFGVIKDPKSGWTSDKPCLFKPGAEKILASTNVLATFRKDEETYQMLGEPKGVVCYICELWRRDKEGNLIKIGEGRGSASLKEGRFRGIENNCIKIAEKRAKIDAVLSTFALSERFTQDLEDFTGENNHQEAEAREDIFDEEMTKKAKDIEKPQQKKKKQYSRSEYEEMIVDLAVEKGVDLDVVLKEEFGVDDIKDIPTEDLPKVKKIIEESEVKDDVPF